MLICGRAVPTLVTRLALTSSDITELSCAATRALGAPFHAIGGFPNAAGGAVGSRRCLADLADRTFKTVRHPGGVAKLSRETWQAERDPLFGLTFADAAGLARIARARTHGRGESTLVARFARSDGGGSALLRESAHTALFALAVFCRPRDAAPCSCHARFAKSIVVRAVPVEIFAVGTISAACAFILCTLHRPVLATRTRRAACTSVFLRKKTLLAQSA